MPLILYTTGKKIRLSHRLFCAFFAQTELYRGFCLLQYRFLHILQLILTFQLLYTVRNSSPTFVVLYCNTLLETYLVRPVIIHCQKLISHIHVVQLTVHNQKDTSHFPLTTLLENHLPLLFVIHCFHQQFFPHIQNNQFSLTILPTIPYHWFSSKISSPPILTTFSYSLTPLNFTPYYHSLQSQIIFLCILRKEDATLEDKRSLDITLYVLQL